MLKKRLIFGLLYSEGNFCLSRNFRLQRVGDFDWLINSYNLVDVAKSIDEITILDVSREQDDFQDFCEIVERIASQVFVPVAAGGRIQNLMMVKDLLNSGADKVIINSLFHTDPEKARNISSEFGAQAIIAGVDVKRGKSSFDTYYSRGESQGLPFEDYILNIQNMGAGEVFIQSIDRDGTSQGLDLGILDFVPRDLEIPLIIGGGIGKPEHFLEGFNSVQIDAVLTANILNFVGDGLSTARNSISRAGVKIPQLANVADFMRHV